jgi:ribosomal protein L21
MKYAIVESGGKQYRAVEGSTIEVDLLDVEVGASVDLDKVLLLVEDEKVSIGTPTLKGAVVSTKVVDHVKGPKVFTFKYSPKKRIRVKTGHRQQYTQLKIESIKVE